MSNYHNFDINDETFESLIDRLDDIPTIMTQITGNSHDQTNQYQGIAAIF